MICEAWFSLRLYVDIWISFCTVEKRDDLEHDPDFRLEVQKLTQRFIIEMEVQLQRADEMRLANERFEKEQKMKVEAERRRRDEEDVQWEEGRAFRVESWRNFVEKARTQKKLKISSSTTATAAAATATTTTTTSAMLDVTMNVITADATSNSLKRPPPPPPPVKPPPPPPPPSSSSTATTTTTASANVARPHLSAMPLRPHRHWAT